jgi:branched-subunit amino acid ABC-type transport system permease component
MFTCGISVCIQELIRTRTGSSNCSNIAAAAAAAAAVVVVVSAVVSVAVVVTAVVVSVSVALTVEKTFGVTIRWCEQNKHKYQQM